MDGCGLLVLFVVFFCLFFFLGWVVVLVWLAWGKGEEGGLYTCLGNFGVK